MPEKRFQNLADLSVVGIDIGKDSPGVRLSETAVWVRAAPSEEGP